MGFFERYFGIGRGAMLNMAADDPPMTICQPIDTQSTHSAHLSTPILQGYGQMPRPKIAPTNRSARIPSARQCVASARAAAPAPQEAKLSPRH
jgi:hypothetical protein